MTKRRGKVKTERSLIARLMRGAPKKDGMQNHGVLPDVNLEGSRAPPTDGLNCRDIDARFGQRSCASRSHRVTGKVSREKVTESRNEPMTSGDTSVGCKPEFGVKWEKGITRTEIRDERTIRICRRTCLLNEDCVAFEDAVAFVRGEKERVLVTENAHGVTKGDLPVVPKDLLVGKNEFAETHEGVKTRQQHSAEK
jgi:hypothetical protein